VCIASTTLLTDGDMDDSNHATMVEFVV